MQRFRPFFICLFQSAMVTGLYLLSSSAFAQKKVVSSDQVWLQSYHETMISERWAALLDGGFRWRDGFDKELAYIIRAGMSYSISPKLRGAGGFAFLGAYDGGTVVRHEYRPYQELLLKDKLGIVNVSHRFRAEERFFKELLSDSARADFNFRFRYSILLGIPVANLSQKKPHRKLILTLGDEIFLNAGREITHRVFDQNRLIISPTVQWNQELSVAFTYNSQFASTPDPETFLQSHVAWLQIRYNPDLGNFRK